MVYRKPVCFKLFKHCPHFTALNLGCFYLFVQNASKDIEEWSMRNVKSPSWHGQTYEIKSFLCVCVCVFRYNPTKLTRRRWNAFMLSSSRGNSFQRHRKYVKLPSTPHKKDSRNNFIDNSWCLYFKCSCFITAKITKYVCHCFALLFFLFIPSINVTN